MSPQALKLERELASRHAAGDFRGAEALHVMLRLAAPDHPETIRWLGELRLASGDHVQAEAAFSSSLAIRPRDALTWSRRALACHLLGRTDAALDSLREIGAVISSADDWFRLGLELDQYGHPEDALRAADRALSANPRLAEARLLRARTLNIVGRSEEAAAEYRTLISAGQRLASAWFGLLDIKTVRLAAAELQQLEKGQNAPGLTDHDRSLLQFALSKALEDAGHYPRAFQSLQLANRLARSEQSWNSALFSRLVDEVRSTSPGCSAPGQATAEPRVIFIVGLPRSGTTLLEQVFAAHPDVAPGGETAFLKQVINRESHRRGQAFPHWVPTTTAADWRRLADHYLELGRSLRGGRPTMTDKAPGNWLYAGAALAMFPDARIVHSLRDPVETCWSCYKQMFARDEVGFAFDFEDLAAYWYDSERLGRHWAQLHRGNYRRQDYHRLVSDQEAQTRELLAFCGLPFDEACLHPHTASRKIWTPSAAQVRQPMRTDTSRAHLYGADLDPLREAIAQRQGRLVG